MITISTTLPEIAEHFKGTRWLGGTETALPLDIDSAEEALLPRRWHLSSFHDAGRAEPVQGRSGRHRIDLQLQTILQAGS